MMAADDVATHPGNPRPGRVFNSPQGQDVYKGASIDYRGDGVTAATFLAVLDGDANAARAAAPGSTGRVLTSGPRDRVLIYYADHGGPGVLGMPSGPWL